MDNPVISVITVCYNAGKYIEQTIQSVIGQSMTGIEYIVVDGGSSDGTLNVIQRYASRIDRFVSEKDNGMYDAMNKGLEMATGEYILFLNADDSLYSPDTLKNAFCVCGDADAIYGESMTVDEQGASLGLRSAYTPHRFPDLLNWKSFRFGMTVSHQSFIIRRRLAQSYDLQYRVCADIDWMIRSLKHCRVTCNSRSIISRFRTGGTSKRLQTLAWKERYMILAKHYGVIPNLINHVYIATRYIVSRKP